MAIENAGSSEVKTIGTWILGASGALTFFGLLNKFLRSGPFKELERRVENLEKSVEDKFEGLTNQRIRDVDAIKSEMTTVQIAIAGLKEATTYQNEMLERIWNRLEHRT